jgi:hypothetical protein
LSPFLSTARLASDCPIARTVAGIGIKQRVSFLWLSEDGTNDASGASASSAASDDVRDGNALDQLKLAGSTMTS